MKKELKEELQKIKTKAGFLKNKDGSVSDKYIFILFLSITCFFVPSLICLHWSFKNHPLPEYAFNIIKLLIDKGTWLIGFLAGYQSIENNTFYQKLKKNFKEKKIVDTATGKN